MKKSVILVLLLLFLPVMMTAQSNNYIRVSGDAGFIANTERDKSFGMGGTLSWMTTDYIFTFNQNNLITIGIKGFNNPYGEGKFISSIMNDENDGFNYIMPFMGYRITKKSVKEGFFVEPRLGVLFGSNYSAFAASPLLGYALNNFDVSIYCDMGFGSNNSAIGKKNFATPGISIAYNIGL